VEIRVHRLADIVGEIRQTFCQGNIFLVFVSHPNRFVPQDKSEEDNHERRDGIKQDLERVIADDLAAGLGRGRLHGAESREFADIAIPEENHIEDKTDFVKE
jgi:hypothetical protein